MAKKPDLFKVNVVEKDIEAYKKIAPTEVYKIKQLAKTFQGLKVTHVNATAMGGGVAELLKSVVPMQRSIGLDSSWYVMPHHYEFFNVTKAIHNFLQGKTGDLSREEKELYLEHNKITAKLLEGIDTDVLIIHDPQPAAALSFFDFKLRPALTIWRCHIDTTNPNEKVWDFLRPYWQVFDHYVFTLKEYAHSDYSPQDISLITPVIDPLSKKNKLIEKALALEFLSKYEIDLERPFMTQISRFDPWKDPLGVIDAFVEAKRKVPELQLVLASQMAEDDPEGVVMLKKVNEYAKDKQDIFLIVNDEENDMLVNSLQTASMLIIQKSIREGFGLTVSEAMWKKNVVIGGDVGGIRVQIDDGKNGFLVKNVKEAADKIVYCLSNPAKAATMGEKAHVKVKENFLLPHLNLNYMNLFDKVFPQ